VQGVPSLNLPPNVDLKHLRAVAFSAGHVVLMTANERGDWAFEAALDNAAAVLLDASTPT
jgi:hypothetical protein